MTTRSDQFIWFCGTVSIVTTFLLVKQILNLWSMCGLGMSPPHLVELRAMLVIVFVSGIRTGDDGIEVW